MRALIEEIRGLVYRMDRDGLLGLDRPASLPRSTRVVPYPSSWRRHEGGVLFLAKTPAEKFLVTAGIDLPLAGEREKVDGRRVGVHPLTAENAAAIREIFPFVAPKKLPPGLPSFGCGDRLGLANPGHLRALRGYRVAPVLAQQSVRELNLTGRSFTQVIDAATWAVLQEGYEGGYAADGDHLKTIDEVRMALSAGATMITLDLSLCLAASGLPPCPAVLLDRADQSFVIGGREVILNRVMIEDFWQIYGAALVFVREADTLCREYRGLGGYDLEVSVDETAEPTRIEDHLIFGLEMERLGIEAFSLAPRFPGEFQKAVDYRGNLRRFETEFALHAVLARRFGHRLSIHSGSDKFAIFPLVGRLTEGRFHLKTAGTSWLLALGVAAAKDPELFRRIYARALESFAEAKKYYHIATEPAEVGPIDSIPDGDLPGLLEDEPSRQLLHITYGQIIQDPGLGPALFRLLAVEEEAYYEAVIAHFRRHLEALGLSE